VGPCRYGMSRPRIAEEVDGIRISVVTANKQSRTVEKERSSSLGVGRGPTTPHRKKSVTMRYTGDFGVGGKIILE
jgi:hypothetical protein